MHFKILWWTKRTNELHLLEIEIFCNIINVFTFTFNQFDASLLKNKQKKKKTYCPQTF